MASLEFAVPPNPWWRGWWWLYTRAVLPVAGAALGGRAWFDVGRFFGAKHLRSLPALPGRRHRRRVGSGRAHRHRRAPHEPRRRSRHVGPPPRRRPARHRVRLAVEDEPHLLPPAFYAAPPGRTRRAWADWWVLLHPPYTLWHLSYVAIGATLAPHFDGGRLAATLARVLPRCGGVRPRPRRAPRPPAAHHDPRLAPHRRRCRQPGRRRRPRHRRAGPSRTRSRRVHRRRRRPHRRAYNLELFGGRLHTDVTFADRLGRLPRPGRLLRPSRDAAPRRSRGRSRPPTRCRRRSARSALRPAHCAAGWPRSTAPSRTTTATPRRCPPRSCSHHSRRPSRPPRGASWRSPWPSSSTAPPERGSADVLGTQLSCDALRSGS